MSNILILGANGQLGSDLCKVLTDANLSFTALTPSELDVTHDNWYNQLKAYSSYKFIINCIAYTNVDKAEDEPGLTFTINSIFVAQLAQFCNAYKITLIHFSTDYVFDGLSSLPYLETSCAHPLNIYGLSKYTADIAISNYHDRYYIFRVAALFGQAGAAGKGGNFITTMQHLGKTRDRITVINDQITSPTATLYIAKCVRYFVTQDIQAYGVYNCTSSNSCSWFAFAQHIFTLSGLDTAKLQPISYASYDFKAKRPQFCILDTAKLSKFYTMPTWQESLAEYMQ